MELLKLPDDPFLIIMKYIICDIKLLTLISQKANSHIKRILKSDKCKLMLTKYFKKYGNITKNKENNLLILINFDPNLQIYPYKIDNNKVIELINENSHFKKLYYSNWEIKQYNRFTGDYMIRKDHIIKDTVYEIFRLLIIVDNFRELEKIYRPYINQERFDRNIGFYYIINELLLNSENLQHDIYEYIKSDNISRVISDQALH